MITLTAKDLAARNVLLDRNHRCKIADFGLSREVDAHTTYAAMTASRGLPVRAMHAGLTLQIKWLAPECLNGTFSTQSDVWAFGVTLWEILHFAWTPYPGLTIEEVRHLEESS